MNIINFKGGLHITPNNPSWVRAWIHHLEIEIFTLITDTMVLSSFVVLFFPAFTCDVIHVIIIHVLCGRFVKCTVVLEVCLINKFSEKLDKPIILQQKELPMKGLLTTMISCWPCIKEGYIYTFVYRYSLCGEFFMA